MGNRIEVLVRDSIDRSAIGVASTVPAWVYNIDDDSFSPEELEKIKKLLSDHLVDEVVVNGALFRAGLAIDETLVEISPKPGVGDPEGDQARASIEFILGRKIGGVSYSQQHVLKGKFNPDQINGLIRGLGGNSVVSDFGIIDFTQYDPRRGSKFHFPKVDLPEVPAFTYLDVNVSDTGLMELVESRDLNLQEMQPIRRLFEDPKFLALRKLNGLDARLTDAEIEGLDQAWSEHCKHKKFTGKWFYTSEDPNDESGLPGVVDNMFKSIIVASTEKIAENIDWLVSVFVDNSGVIRLNDHRNLYHKVETHNHPSAINSFFGANTGTGGLLRDLAETGIGGNVVSSQYWFRGPHMNAFTDLPAGIEVPEQMLKGLVRGVRDYGNKMGIPTQCGNVFIDNGWLKPGVYVGGVAVELAEINGRKTHEKVIKPGYLGISIGGRVGKDGIHGASGSSTDLAAGVEDKLNINQEVQIGNPIEERSDFEVMQILRNLGLIEAAQDCGAGGWNSAVGELAEFTNGATMDLTNVPVKYAGLTGWEKLISESQERNVVVIKPENLDRVVEICKHHGVEATKVAEFNDSGYYKVIDQDKTIAFLPMDFMTRGLPQWEIKAHWKPPKLDEPDLPVLENYTETLENLISQPNMQIYDWIVTRFDHEVKGGSRIKPIVGVGRGKSDAIAYKPVLEDDEVVIESWGSNPWQGDIDTYHMGVNNVVDGIGKIIAAGGSLKKITFNGNTTCPKPEDDPYVAAQVLRMLKGAADAEIAFGTPTISGKDSTSMERSYISTETGEKVHVKAKPELLKSSLGIIDNDSTLTTSDFKLPEDLVYVIGDTRDELGGSEFYLMLKETGKNVPKSDLVELKNRFQAVEDVIKEGLLHSAQYLSKGGLGYALSNLVIGGDLGIDAELDGLDESLGRADKILFSETTGRFVVTVHPSQEGKFLEMMKGQYVKRVGKVTEDQGFKVGYNGNNVVQSQVGILREKNKGSIKL